jgi:hypothetical protein
MPAQQTQFTHQDENYRENNPDQAKPVIGTKITLVGYFS